MNAIIDRILFAVVARIADAIDRLNASLADLEPHLPTWAQDQDNRLIAYFITACTVCLIAVVAI